LPPGEDKTAMLECELGLIDADRKPRPVLKEIDRFWKWLSGLDFELPDAAIDGICIASKAQDQWGTCFASYILAKQAGVNIGFASFKDELPKSDIYILPSVRTSEFMPAEKFDKLKERIYEGAKLYISNDDVWMAKFSELTGMRVLDSENNEDEGTMCFDGEVIAFKRSRRLIISPCGAEVLCCDDRGIPAFTKYKYGKGMVYYLNFPLEKSLLNKKRAFDGNACEIYRMLFKDCGEKIIESDNKYLGITHHWGKDNSYVIIINYSNSEIMLNLRQNEKYKLEKVYAGSMQTIEPMGTIVLSFARKL
jgi:hypothetical protein